MLNRGPNEQQYETISGEVLRFPRPVQAVADFLEQIWLDSQLSDVTADDLTQKVWSPDNPLMKKGPRPGQAHATLETYKHPVFRVMLDIIDRKRVATGSLDLSAARARYTFTVDQAAEQLAIDAATVRRAIREGRLAAWKDRSTYWLDPSAVENYRVSTRGRRAEVQISQGGRGVPVDPDLIRRADLRFVPGSLAVREGTEGNYSLRVKGAVKNPPEGQNERDQVRSYLIAPPWREIAVIRTKKAENDHRLFILRPREPEADGMDTGLTFAGFHVRGHFEIVETVNNSREVLERWKSYDNVNVLYSQRRSRQKGAQ